METLLAIAAEPEGHEVFLIVGSDTLPEMVSWREPQRIFELCTVAVAARPGAPWASPRRGRGWWPSPAPSCPSPPPRCVSAPARGRSVRYLVPDAVADYIETRRLYR